MPAGDAKVLIVKFNDYQCPACKLTYESYKPLLQKYVATGQVKYVVKQYPLEPECNPGVAERGALGLVRGGGVCPHGESEGDVR